jgi:hypothetical protein
MREARSIAPAATTARDRFDLVAISRASVMLPASRWFVLVAAIAILAMGALALIVPRLEATIPAGSPPALRLAAFVPAADAGLLLLFGFSIVPPAIREAARLLARVARPAHGERDDRAPLRVADLVAVGVWAVAAAGIAMTLPSLSDLMAVAALLSQR